MQPDALPMMPMINVAAGALLAWEMTAPHVCLSATSMVAGACMQPPSIPLLVCKR
jgi:hypothetical protein